MSCLTRRKALVRVTRHYALIAECDAFAKTLTKLKDFCGEKWGECLNLIILCHCPLAVKMGAVKVKLKEFKNVKILFTYREANMIADFLAKTPLKGDKLKAIVDAMVKDEKEGYLEYRLPRKGKFVI
ncbi:hypothetical protein COLO4_23459 [Corchorus olitorius]|uniref:Uncharacterized protein n=1 Tax=Corchorus olitorius TaxID=93759 RepID=A0A1R3IGF2_9ROSI|nr:hypothetical protein COLO4_23459 [Corchorus olitorius]